MGATTYIATATSTERTFAFRGREVPAVLVTCTCASPNCGGTTILAPRATVDGFPAKGRKAALHGLVCNRKVLGFPTA
jgi:hypothetical protein